MSKKRLYIAIASVLGLISVLMPWITFQEYSLNAVNATFQDGYFFGLGYIIILVCLFWGNPQSALTQKKNWIILGTSALIFVFVVGDVIANNDAFDMGASLGLGAYVCLLASGFIAVFSFLDRNVSAGDSTVDFDKEKMVELTQKGTKIAKSAAKVTQRIAKSAVDEVKKEMNKK